MENYEKKYKEALERARQVHTTNVDENKKSTEYIFPELKESEDERIRKEIISFITDRKNWFPKEETKASWIAWLEKQGEQNPVNKTEPKFKVGDWVVYNNANVYQVKKIDYTNIIPRYELENIDGDKLSIPFTADYNLRNWTIQDAKDCDVLVNGSNIFIFSNLSNTRAMGYCHINLDDGRFYDDKGKNECFGLIDSVFIPATKEQRDLLFQKMKEAGYEWDDENKELKKIEKQCEQILANSEKTCKDEQNPTWSEEDERIYNEIIDFFLGDVETRCTTIDKQRHFGYWLKSLKPQWKPSEEQMEIIDMILTNESMDDNVARILRELKEQLEELQKEE